MTAQYHSDSVPVPASAGAFEVEKYWQLLGADAAAVVPLGVGQDVQGVVAPKKHNSNKEEVKVCSGGRRLIHHSPGNWKK